MTFETFETCRRFECRGWVICFTVFPWTTGLSAAVLAAPRHMALRRKPSAPAFAVLTVTAAALLAATAAQDTPTGTPPADGAAPTATEAFSEAFGEESRNEAFRGWMMEVRER